MFRSDRRFAPRASLRLRPRVERLEKRLPFDASAGLDDAALGELSFDDAHSSTLPAEFGGGWLTASTSQPTVSGPTTPAGQSTLSDDEAAPRSTERTPQGEALPPGPRFDIELIETIPSRNIPNLTLNSYASGTTEFLSNDSTVLKDGRLLTVALVPFAAEQVDLVATWTWPNDGVFATITLETLTYLDPAFSYRAQLSVASRDDGGFVVGWNDDLGVHTQRFDAEGVPIAARMTHETAATGAVYGQIEVIGLPGDHWAAVWRNDLGGDIRYQTFNHNDTPLHAQLAINTTGVGLGQPFTIQSDGATGFTLAIDELTPDMAQLYRTIHRIDEGSLASTLIFASDSSYGFGNGVTVLSDGSYLIVRGFYDAGYVDASIQRYDVDGTLLSNTAIGTTTRMPELTPATDGATVVAYQLTGSLQWDLQAWTADGNLISPWGTLGMDPVAVVQQPKLIPHPDGGVSFTRIVSADGVNEPQLMVSHRRLSTSHWRLTLDDPESLFNAANHRVQISGLPSGVGLSMGNRVDSSTVEFGFTPTVDFLAYWPDDEQITTLLPRVWQTSDASIVLSDAIVLGTSTANFIDAELFAATRFVGGPAVDTLSVSGTPADYDLVWDVVGETFTLTDRLTSLSRSVTQVEMVQFDADIVPVSQLSIAFPSTFELNVNASIGFNSPSENSLPQSGGLVLGDATDRVVSTTLADGGVVTVLMRPGNLGRGVLFGRITSPDGITALAPEPITPTNLDFSASLDNVWFDVAPTPDGGYLVAWNLAGNVSFQKMNDANQPQASVQTIAADTATPATARVGLITQDNGLWAVAWINDSATVRYQWFDSSGAEIGPPGEVLAAGPDQQFRDVTWIGLPGGGADLIIEVADTNVDQRTHRVERFLETGVPTDSLWFGSFAAGIESEVAPLGGDDWLLVLQTDVGLQVVRQLGSGASQWMGEIATPGASNLRNLAIHPLGEGGFLVTAHLVDLELSDESTSVLVVRLNGEGAVVSQRVVAEFEGVTSVAASIAERPTGDVQLDWVEPATFGTYRWHQTRTLAMPNIPLVIELQDPGAVLDAELDDVIVHGLPPGIGLNWGRPLPDGDWVVSLNDVASLSLLHDEPITDATIEVSVRRREPGVLLATNSITIATSSVSGSEPLPTDPTSIDLFELNVVAGDEIEGIELPPIELLESDPSRIDGYRAIRLNDGSTLVVTRRFLGGFTDDLFARRYSPEGIPLDDGRSLGVDISNWPGDLIFDVEPLENGGFQLFTQDVNRLSSQTFDNDSVATGPSVAIVGTYSPGLPITFAAIRLPGDRFAIVSAAFDVALEVRVLDELGIVSAPLTLASTVDPQSIRNIALSPHPTADVLVSWTIEDSQADSTLVFAAPVNLLAGATSIRSLATPTFAPLGNVHVLDDGRWWVPGWSMESGIDRPVVREFSGAGVVLRDVDVLLDSIAMLDSFQMTPRPDGGAVISYLSDDSGEPIIWHQAFNESGQAIGPIWSSGTFSSSTESQPTLLVGPGDRVDVLQPSMDELTSQLGVTQSVNQPFQTPLDVTLSGANVDYDSSVTRLIVRDLPENASLSHGTRLEPTTWAVPMDQLAQLRILSPQSLPTTTLRLAVGDPTSETMLAVTQLTLNPPEPPPVDPPPVDPPPADPPPVDPPPFEGPPSDESPVVPADDVTPEPSPPPAAPPMPDEPSPPPPVVPAPTTAPAVPVAAGPPMPGASQPARPAATVPAANPVVGVPTMPTAPSVATSGASNAAGKSAPQATKPGTVESKSSPKTTKTVPKKAAIEAQADASTESGTETNAVEAAIAVADPTAASVAANLSAVDRPSADVPMQPVNPSKPPVTPPPSRAASIAALFPGSNASPSGIAFDRPAVLVDPPGSPEPPTWSVVEATYSNPELLIPTTFDSEQLFATMNEVEESVQSIAETMELVTGAAVVIATGVSVAHVGWLLRGTVLLTKMMSSMPIWVAFDPLPLLSHAPASSSTLGGESLLDIARALPTPSDPSSPSLGTEVPQ